MHDYQGVLRGWFGGFERWGLLTAMASCKLHIQEETTDSDVSYDALCLCCVCRVKMDCVVFCWSICLGQRWIVVFCWSVCFAEFQGGDGSQVG
jgi:hypothetical protein